MKEDVNGLVGLRLALKEIHFLLALVVIRKDSQQKIEFFYLCQPGRLQAKNKNKEDGKDGWIRNLRASASATKGKFLILHLFYLCFYLRPPGPRTSGESSTSAHPFSFLVFFFKKEKEKERQKDR